MAPSVLSNRPTDSNVSWRLANALSDQLAAAAFALAVVAALEWLSVQLMLPWSFRLGLPLMFRRFSAPLGLYNVADGVPSQVRLRPTGDNEWIFRHAGGWFERETLQLRGTARLRGGERVMVGRASCAVLAFVLLIAISLNSWAARAILLVLLVVAWFFEDTRFDSDCAVVARALLRDA